MGERYIDLHLNDDGEYIVYLNDDVPGLVRAKIESRFTSAKHYVYIQYNPAAVGMDAISGWHCKCKNGSRVSGCCAHVASVR